MAIGVLWPCLVAYQDKPVSKSRESGIKNKIITEEKVYPKKVYPMKWESDDMGLTSSKTHTQALP
jgi:hypothetical protein